MLSLPACRPQVPSAALSFKAQSFPLHLVLNVARLSATDRSFHLLELPLSLLLLPLLLLFAFSSSPAPPPPSLSVEFCAGRVGFRLCILLSSWWRGHHPSHCPLEMMCIFH